MSGIESGVLTGTRVASGANGRPLGGGYMWRDPERLSPARLAELAARDLRFAMLAARARAEAETARKRAQQAAQTAAQRSGPDDERNARIRHGSASGYRQHMRLQIRPCQDCKDAVAAEMRRKRANGLAS